MSDKVQSFHIHVGLVFVMNKIISIRKYCLSISTRYKLSCPQKIIETFDIINILPLCSSSMSPRKVFGDRSGTKLSGLSVWPLPGSSYEDQLYSMSKRHYYCWQGCKVTRRVWKWVVHAAGLCQIDICLTQFQRVLAKNKTAIVLFVYVLISSCNLKSLFPSMEFEW